MALSSETDLAVKEAPSEFGLRPSEVQEPGAYWADFYQPSAEPIDMVQWMELALATRRGPRLLADLVGRGR
ncbi:hypothetical protein ACFC0D_02065 [Streptomyces sp. NPDC056222]|uniref:hypothetical protein n=1 Tax=Streptomyces sp. NPDC056222 TaxID=3345749 RepID=UPI0035D5750F